LYVTVVNEIDLSFTSGQSLILNKDFEIVTQYEVFPKTDKRLIGRIKDVYFNDGILTSLFVWSDTKGNKNLITALQSDIDTGARLTKFSQFFALSFDKMSIDRAEKGQVSLIMQDNLMGGQNIVYNTLKDGASTVTVPLSKIRGVSALPSYYEADGKRILIFSDLNKKARDIYIASSDLDLIKKTTSYRTINFAQVFVTCIIISIVAIFAALIMILVLEPLPGIVLLILYKLTDQYKHKFKVQMWVPAAFHTIVKIYASLKLVETARAISEVDLSILGSRPFIYGLLILSSLFAMFCTHRCAKQRNDYDSVINYTIFVLLDLSLYACTLLAFILSSLLIYKL
ncbi:MAG: hypothetical protein H7X94_04390, partial [Vallitaleaceae bacterium]|nr:hypothetical protein [Vallitaleaceae bacterium]